MAEPEIIDAQAVEEEATIGQQVVHAPVPALAVAPTVKPQELVDRLAAIREAQENAMARDVDYGVIPGTNKPTLFKAGAEKLAVLFQLDVQLRNEKIWGPGDHLTVISHATVYHAPTGARLGYGEGVCTTRERKYAYRQQQRACPQCGQPAVIKGKAEYGGGWLCFAKKGGCGAQFPDGAPEIESQETGEIENPDLPDVWNTCVKMAEKRARVDAVLAVTSASALFTQDVEDGQGGEGSGSSPTAPSSGGSSPPTADTPTITASQRDKLILPLVKKNGLTGDHFLKLLGAYGVSKLDDLPRNRVNALRDAINAAASDVPPNTAGLEQPALEPREDDAF